MQDPALTRRVTQACSREEEAVACSRMEEAQSPTTSVPQLLWELLSSSPFGVESRGVSRTKRGLPPTRLPPELATRLGLAGREHWRERWYLRQ